jgi:hypothetical protein
VLDRYSAESQRALELAREEAGRLKHPYVGTEHLLLGLLAEGDNAASRALQGAGASLALCREKVTEALASRSSASTADAAAELELTDRASRALDRAGRLSARLKSDEVETSHVLISVLDVEGTAGQVLRGLSVDLGAVRDALFPRTPEPLAADQITEAEILDRQKSFGPDPICPRCGTGLKGALGRSIATSADGVDFEVVHCTSCGASLGVSRAPLTTRRAANPSPRAGNGPSPDPVPPRPRRPRA